MEQSLKIREFWSVIKSRIIFIVMAGFIFALLGGAISAYMVDPSYEASRKIVVNNQAEQLDYNTVMTNFQYANTYSDFIYSEVVLEKVISDLSLDTSVKELEKQIDVTSKNESQVITITVKDTDYERAVQIVNATATVFQNRVKEIMRLDNVMLFPPAEIKANAESSSPGTMLFIVVGMVAGVGIGLSIAFVQKLFSTTIDSEKDAVMLLESPVLGTVSKERHKQLKEMTAAKDAQRVYSTYKNLGREAE
ncbi:Wzz/FepE/Etk N-terminal domain-containing protein [Jeotgalibacillus terrae]|uniref:YveK family protein n=1 Tax=Jeotgalibacillus terrae TaxID=587735 RepID=A0ABW5ZCR1_9BACL|nr:capsular polysaccharide biosynthesis protein [Jeotgalibacillus terrae]